MSVKVTVDIVKRRIREILMELTDLDVDSITDDEILTEELGVESIAVVQIFLTCQEEFDVMLADEMNLAEPLSIQILAEKIAEK